MNITGRLDGGVIMQSKELSNIELLKEIAELINEETDMEQMLQGALRKLLEGTIFETGWIFFINEKGKQELIAHENLPKSLEKNDCRHLQKGGCWCVSRYRNGELQKASNIIECQRIENAHKNGIWVGICGELAADISLTETFIRMGVDELSVSPPYVLKLRQKIREIDLSK